MFSMRAVLALLLAGFMALAACSADEVTEAVDEVAEEGADAVEGAADAVEEGAEEIADGADAMAEEAEEMAEGAEEMVEDAADSMTEESDVVESDPNAITVDFAEWTLEMPDTLAAGPQTYTVNNMGEFPHRLAVVKGTSYEELPQLGNGAVDTDALGDDFIGDQEVNVDPGGSGTIEWDLPAGDYVFFCPIAVGPNSHAGAGQVKSVTIS